MIGNNRSLNSSLKNRYLVDKTSYRGFIHYSVQLPGSLNIFTDKYLKKSQELNMKENCFIICQRFF